jgi:hypothetical protein
LLFAGGAGQGAGILGPLSLTVGVGVFGSLVSLPLVLTLVIGER